MGAKPAPVDYATPPASYPWVNWWETQIRVRMVIFVKKTKKTALSALLLHLTLLCRDD